MFLGFFKWTLLFFGGLWPTVPEALGTFTRSCRLKLLMFSGTFAHVPGHKCSCTRAQIVTYKFNVSFAAFPAY